MTIPARCVRPPREWFGLSRRGARAGLRRALVVVVWVLSSGGCAARVRANAAASELSRDGCATALTAIAPTDAVDVLFVRPRAAFEHPQLGPLLRRSLDARAERALLGNAERVGFDPRTLDRALRALTPRGVLYLGAGPLDARSVEERLWERLLDPRSRSRDAEGGVRLEGALVSQPVALRVRPRCGLAAYAEGGDVRDVDRLLLGREALAQGSSARDEPDANTMLRWRARVVPVVAGLDAPMIAAIRAFELRVLLDPTGHGLEAMLTLRGALPSDAVQRVQRSLDAVRASPLGEIAGASSWLSGDAVSIESQREGLRVRVRAPWRALNAIADALRGDVGLRELEAASSSAPVQASPNPMARSR